MELIIYGNASIQPRVAGDLLPYSEGKGAANIDANSTFVPYYGKGIAGGEDTEDTTSITCKISAEERQYHEKEYELEDLLDKKVEIGG
jgi:hypothetical protein